MTKKVVKIFMLFVILLLFVIFQNYFVIFLKNLRVALNGTFNKDFNYEVILECKNNINSNNNDLKVSLEGKLTERGLNYKKLRIFSNYPFNNFSKIVLEGGSDIGLKENMPVLINGGFLLGRVSEVKNKKAVVETIFSSTWKSSVFLGDKKVKGLLEGGTNPTVNFVLSENKIESKTRIYNADERFPLDLEIGNILEEKENANWKSFTVSFPYDLNSINEVWVITNFE
jgi:cell shape-determining protein MreC